eukprot:563467-Prymnesium_polylepis.1
MRQRPSERRGALWRSSVWRVELTLSAAATSVAPSTPILLSGAAGGERVCGACGGGRARRA